VLDVVTGAQRVLATSNSEFFISPTTTGKLSWSPNGDVIALDVIYNTLCSIPTLGPGLVECGENEVATVSTTDGAWTRFAPFPSGQPQFSPNGLEIAYVDFANGVTIASASGADPRHLGVTGGWPAWSSDGKDLVISSQAPPANNGNYDLFEVGVHGGKLEQFTNTPTDETYASWAQPLTLCTVPKLKGRRWRRRSC
jgi:Tol biopolymer transport system component